MKFIVKGTDKNGKKRVLVFENNLGALNCAVWLVKVGYTEVTVTME
jgi:hypothetical protein